MHDENGSKVSVVICVFSMDRINDVVDAITSISNQILCPYELIISVDHNEKLYNRLIRDYGDSLLVNNGAVSETKIPVSIIHNTGVRGFSATKNHGIRHAKGDILAFLDDDATAEKEWLLHLVKTLESQDTVAVGGRTVPNWVLGYRPAWFAEELDWVIGATYKGLPLDESEVRNISGGNSAFLRSVFEGNGYFGEAFGRLGDNGVGEEAEFCLRMKNIMPEGRIIYQPLSVIHHKVPLKRSKLKYLVTRSFDEGVFKSKLKVKTSKKQKKSLSTEYSYLTHLFFTAIPGKVIRFYKKGNLKQAGTIVLSIASTITGYIYGKLRY